MKTICIIFCYLLTMNFALHAQGPGEEVFKSVCAACHTINKGRLVGPDLSKVYNIRTNEWIIRFVRSSQQFIKSGDTAAVNIYNEFSKIPMPDNHLTDAQILSVIEYIKASDLSALAAGPKPAEPAGKAAALNAVVTVDSTTIIYSVNKVPEGRSLFYGYKRFRNGVPACVGCHTIDDETILRGGKLAINLTGAYKKLGPAGIKSIMISPPFPVMKVALANKVPDENEIRAVISLLKELGNNQYRYSILDSAGIFFGTVAFVMAMLIFSQIYFFYDYRKIP
jgi:mono/diheme cytochrome c family protein